MPEDSSFLLNLCVLFLAGDPVYIWIFMLFFQMGTQEEPDVPEILKMGRRGANVKAWTVIRLNKTSGLLQE